MNGRWPEDVLDDDDDNGTMPANVKTLSDNIVGRRIVKAEQSWFTDLILTLDDGRQVTMANSSDCCAFTSLEGFFLDPSTVDHMILGVDTTGGYTTWHIYGDFGDIMRLKVGWSAGNPFDYGYGFYISVKPAPPAKR